MLKDIVERSLTSFPLNLSRAYFPDEQTIRNFIIKFTYEKHQSKIDQNALKIKIEQWKNSQKMTIFIFSRLGKKMKLQNHYFFANKQNGKVIY